MMGEEEEKLLRKVGEAASDWALAKVDKEFREINGGMLPFESALTAAVFHHTRYLNETARDEA